MPPGDPLVPCVPIPRVLHSQSGYHDPSSATLLLRHPVVAAGLFSSSPVDRAIRIADLEDELAVMVIEKLDRDRLVGVAAAGRSHQENGDHIPRVSTDSGG